MAVNTMTFISGFSLRDLTTRLQSVDVREVEVEHDHVRLESLRRLQHGAAVRDASHDVAVQCQHPADGFHHSRVVVRDQHAGSLGNAIIVSGLESRRRQRPHDAGTV